ncbi:hypothetical protein HMPREF9303_2586 [Prevotella denticola CRIS 18C-A]|uniref:Uncharacterized protein n=1 Tax=Prevotella denticola CRIS 18C-A TaxID=944557 RepID=F0H8T6_9BACT|nr:hypothetical protein HMPREF9303_2586 [Prevotella denticola CRIS 18C-A]
MEVQGAEGVKPDGLRAVAAGRFQELSRPHNTEKYTGLWFMTAA